MKVLSNKYLLFIFRLILGFVFIYSGIEKIINPTSFSEAVSNYKLLPDIFINFFAIILPWIELIAGLLLLFGIAVRENSLIINSLLIVFIAAITIGLIRGLNIDCGCFGTSGGTKIGFTKLLENIILLLLGIFLMMFGSNYLVLKES